MGEEERGELIFGRYWGLYGDEKDVVNEGKVEGVAVLLWLWLLLDEEGSWTPKEKTGVEVDRGIMTMGPARGLRYG